MPSRSSCLSLLHASTLAILLCWACASRAAAGNASDPRQIMPLDAGWRFMLGDDPAAKQPGFNDSQWRTLDLPHDWSIEEPLNPPPEGTPQGGFFMHGIGWYRKSFTLPANLGKKVVIEFDGVYMNSEVWINGYFLGRRPNGFIGFRYDLTEYLNTDGAPNVLAIRIDDSAEPSTRWYSGSGIYRHVRLITTGFTHFRLDGGIRITTPEVAPDKSVVEVETIIDAHFFSAAEQRAKVKAKASRNNRPIRRAAILRASVMNPDGTVAASAQSSLTLENMLPGQRAVQRITVPRPHLWSDATPELYRLRSTLELDGDILDETSTTFGIRQLAFDPAQGLRVNGAPTKLKGVCLHQDAGSFGNAVPQDVWAMRLAMLKAGGCNAVRPSHHPFAPEFYDLCDRMGIYVFDEAFDEWTRGWPYNYTENSRGKAKYGYHLFFNQWYDTDLRAMLRRDRNHPCVVLYSIGNEVPDQLNPDGCQIARKLVAICHQEDPTRPATSACDQSAMASRNGFMDELDIYGYNYVDRLYGADTYAPEHARFPQRVLLGTENSSAIHNWLGVRDLPCVIGEFIWTGIDYLGEAGDFPRRGFNYGMIDLAMGAKPEFHRRAACWSAGPVLALSVSGGQNPVPARVSGRLGRPSWNWEAGTSVTIHAITNCDEVELALGGRTIGRREVSRDLYVTTWSLPFAPGTLSAVGYRAGRPVARQKLVTAGAAARLQLTAIPAPLARELAFYEVTVVDLAGVRVFDAAPAVTIKVEGAGRLASLDSADVTYGGLFKTNTRDAWQGRLLATVQRTAPQGEIRVIATAAGLGQAQVIVRSLPVQ